MGFGDLSVVGIEGSKSVELGLQGEEIECLGNDIGGLGVDESVVELPVEVGFREGVEVLFCEVEVLGGEEFVNEVHEFNLCEYQFCNSKHFDQLSVAWLFQLGRGK